MIAVSCSSASSILRKVGLDDSGPLSALLLLGAMTGAFAGGMLLKGKSGWCSTICPLLPVQRIYGQTPFALVGNSTASRASAARRTATTSTRAPPTWPTSTTPTATGAGYRQVLRRRLPGPDPRLLRDRRQRRARDGALHGGQHRRSSRSRSTFVKVSAHTITSTFGAIAFGSSTGRGRAATLEPATWPVRAAAIALAAVWLVRTWRKEKPFLAQAAAPVAAVAAGGAASRSIASNRALTLRRARGHVRPRQQARRRQGGPEPAGDRRGQRDDDRGRLPDGRLRRRPGRDQGRDGVPVAASPTTRRPTLERLGLRRRTRGWPAARASKARSGRADARQGRAPA